MKKNNKIKNKKELKELYQQYSYLTDKASYVIQNKYLLFKIDGKYYKNKTMKAIVALLQRFDNDKDQNKWKDCDLRLVFFFNERPRPLGSPYKKPGEPIYHGSVELSIINDNNNQILAVYNYKYINKKVIAEDSNKFYIYLSHNKKYVCIKEEFREEYYNENFL